MAVQMDRIVPLIGPMVVGPLGVAHLPRIWLKAILDASGLMPDGYFPDYKGFNQRVIDAIGLEPEPFFTFLATLPTYPQTERWVREHAARLDPVTVARLNLELPTWVRPEPIAAEARARIGWNGTARESAVLIDLEDWAAMHADLVAHRHADLAPIIPMVSSSSRGPFGLIHLPRLWMKALLAAVKALPEGWNTGCGADEFVAKTIGFDLANACAFIRAELPTYLQFEDWLHANLAQPVEDFTKPQLNFKLRSPLKPEDKAALEWEEAGAPGLGSRDWILINDLVDWKYLHDQIVARRPQLSAAPA
jgi:hypothetical protein